MHKHARDKCVQRVIFHDKQDTRFETNANVYHKDVKNILLKDFIKKCKRVLWCEGKFLKKRKMTINVSTAILYLYIYYYL